MITLNPGFGESDIIPQPIQFISTELLSPETLANLDDMSRRKLLAETELQKAGIEAELQGLELDSVGNESNPAIEEHKRKLKEVLVIVEKNISLLSV